MQQPSLLAVASVLFTLASPALAQTNNYTGATGSSWGTVSNWSLNSVPTSGQDVLSANGTEVRIQTATAAVAGNLTIGGSSGTSIVALRNDSLNSLTVSGNITLAPGGGTGQLSLGTGTGFTSTLTIGGGTGSIIDGGGVGAATIAIFGHMGTLGLSSATADNLYVNQNSSGSLTIGSGQTYTVTTTRVGSATANVTHALTVNGTLVSTTINLGYSAASGTNDATFTLNDGGLIQATTLRRPGSQNITFNWNGGTIQNESASNLTVDATSGTLTIGLAGTGTHTFEADSGRTITVASTAVLADQAGQNGTLTKSGLGTLTLNSTNTYTGATSINAGTLILGSSGSIANSSTINVAAGAILNVASVTGGFSVGSAQTLGGSGNVTGSATINGNLRPGNSPGVLGFSSALNLGSTANIQMEINGSGTRGTDYDGIDVTGALTYGGNLDLAIASPFAPGDYSFSLFNSASKAGTFATVTLSGAYTGNLNGVGDVWSLTSDGNTWTFTESTGVLAVSAVPEPSTWALLGLFALTCAGWKLCTAKRRDAVHETKNPA